MKAKTIEELRKWINKNKSVISAGKYSQYVIPVDLLIEHLEQKLIQPEPQRGSKSAKEYIHSKYWFEGAYIGIDEDSVFQLMEEYAKQSLPIVSEPKQVTDGMIEQIDKLILNWLKSRSENVTQLSFDIVQYLKSK